MRSLNCLWNCFSRTWVLLLAGGLCIPQVGLDGVDLLLDGGPVAGWISTLMWVAARAVGFLWLTLMRRLRFSYGTRRWNSVSPITSRIHKSPARRRRMTRLWASPRYTPGYINPHHHDMNLLAASVLLSGLGPDVLKGIPRRIPGPESRSNTKEVNLNLSHEHLRE